MQELSETNTDDMKDGVLLAHSYQPLRRRDCSKLITPSTVEGTDVISRSVSSRSQRIIVNRILLEKFVFPGKA